jgi:ribosome biogenesis GTPase
LQRRAPTHAGRLNGAFGVIGGWGQAQGPGGHGSPYFLSIITRAGCAFIVTDGLQRGLVVSTGKNAAWVALDGETQTRVAQLRRQTGKRSMPVPGDVVYVRILEDEKTVVDRVEERTFTLERRTAEGRSKTMAANVDMLVTVMALADPPPRLITLDQLLAFAELESIDAMVVLTKPDLASPGVLAGITELYESLGYRTLPVNPKAGERVEDLREALVARHSLLCGNSGVGKSSIFRALGGEAVVGDVSRHGMGRQTTSASRLYRLPDGFLIDSPGVNEFGLGKIAPPELIHGFREMVQPSTACRFTDCTHLREPGCGVRAAVEAGTIAQSRYASYERILLEPT